MVECLPSKQVVVGSSPIIRSMRTMEEVNKRLQELSELKEGWMDGDGEPLDPESIQRARWLCEALQAASKPLPHIYPTLSGGLSLEWNDGLPDVFC